VDTPTPKTRLENQADCEALCRTLAEVAMALGARGVIVAISVDRAGHSDFGLSARGPCLELEGLARRVGSFADNVWRHAESPVINRHGGTFYTSATGAGGHSEAPAGAPATRGAVVTGSVGLHGVGSFTVGTRDGGA
jgi:hypothetical protein